MKNIKVDEKVYIKDNAIVIEKDAPLHGCAVPLSWCDGFQELLFCIIQLSDFRWMTADLISRFVALAMQENEIEPPASWASGPKLTPIC